MTRSRELTVRLEVVLRRAGISPMLAIHLPEAEFYRFRNSGRKSYELLVGEWRDRKWDEEKLLNSIFEEEVTYV